MTIKVEIDWGRDGFGVSGYALQPEVGLQPHVGLQPGYVGVGGDDVTAKVRRHDRISVSYGRDQSTALAPTVSGRGGFTLDNSSREYTPRNTGSPLYGNLKPARPVRITRTVGATTYTLFEGHTDDQPLNPNLLNKSVTLSLVDFLADLRGIRVTTELYSSIYTGQAIGYILDAAGWAGDRDLDTGATVIPWWWEDNTDALDALEKVIRSEGPPAFVTIGPDGEFVFRDRHHRITRSASITSQGTWQVDEATQPVIHRDDFSYNEAWSNIINTGNISVSVRTPGETQQVWTMEGGTWLTPSETRLITATSTDPFLDVIVPVEGVDFNMYGGSVASVSLLNVSATSATIQMVAGPTGAAVDQLQLRAKPVKVAYTTQVSYTDAESVTDYGQRVFPGDLPWCNIYDAEAVLRAAITQRAQPLPIVTARFMVARNTVAAAAILPRDLSDRVTVVEPETGLSDDFYIESIQHDLSGEHDHAVTFGLELAATDTPSAAEVLRWGSTTAGHRIGEGKWGL